MTAASPDRDDRIERTLETVLENIQALDTKVGNLDTKVGQLDTKVEKLDTELRSTNEQVKKWDGRLWGLTLALISTAWAGIIGATAVVITRSLTGS